MSEQQPRLTVEQIFKKSLAYQHISENFDKYVHYAMQQYADQETAQLRQELEQMKAQRDEAMKWAKYFKPWSSTWPESVEADFKEFLSSLDK